MGKSFQLEKMYDIPGIGSCASLLYYDIAYTQFSKSLTAANMRKKCYLCLIGDDRLFPRENLINRTKHISHCGCCGRVQIDQFTFFRSLTDEPSGRLSSSSFLPTRARMVEKKNILTDIICLYSFQNYPFSMKFEYHIW